MVCVLHLSDELSSMLSLPSVCNLRAWEKKRWLQKMSLPVEAKMAEHDLRIQLMLGLVH